MAKNQQGEGEVGAKLKAIGLDLALLPPHTPVPILDQNDGQRVIESETGVIGVVPALPFEWYVDADGNVVPLAISTNRDAENFDAKYEKHAKATAKRAGWIPFYDLDEHGRGIIVDEDALVAEILKRRATAKKRGEPFEKMTKDRTEEIATTILQGNSKSIDRLVGTVADLIKSQGGKRAAKDEV